MPLAVHVRRRLGALTLGGLLLLGGLTVAGCGSDDSSSTATAAAKAPATGGTASKPRTIGLVRFLGTDVYANGALKAVADYGEKKGWKVVDIDAQGSADKANAALTNLATQKVDAVVVSVYPTVALSSGLAATRAAKIPVANWGGGLGDGVPIAADVSIGAPIAERIVKDMGDGGKLLSLGYTPGLPCKRREDALDKALQGTQIKKDAKQIKLPGQVDSGSQLTTAWAAANPKGSAPKLAVWGCFDDPATGAVAALQAAGRSDVAVYGLNGTPDALSLVKAGKMAATEFIDSTKQGNEIAGLLEKYWASPSAFKPVEIGGDAEVVDGTNVEAFLAEHPELAK